MTGGEVSPGAVSSFMRELQSRLCERFERVDGDGRFGSDEWEHASGGGGCSRVLTGGRVFEKIGVNRSLIRGERLPQAATEKRPELAGRGFEASGVSVVAHPLNPHVPAAHCNVRFFVADAPTGERAWWFGGGFDLTPYYPVREDVVAWHRAARAVCAPYGEDVYPRLKRSCDEYFMIPHRNETRGVGGLFFEDLDEWGFDACFSFVREVADCFGSAYSAVVEKRRATAYNKSQKAFQLIRRGRYAEFNLIYDRGTLFGLQSRGRAESILMSLPPRVDWVYNPTVEPEAEAALADYLQPRDWLGDDA